MKLLVAIVQDADASRLSKALSKAGYSATKLASTGSFLREGNTTFLIGVEDQELAEVRGTIAEHCRTRTRLLTPSVPLSQAPDPFLAQALEVQVGGAVVFVLEAEDFFRI